MAEVIQRPRTSGALYCLCSRMDDLARVPRDCWYATSSASDEPREKRHGNRLKKPVLVHCRERLATRTYDMTCGTIPRSIPRMDWRTNRQFSGIVRPITHRCGLEEHMGFTVDTTLNGKVAEGIVTLNTTSDSLT